jgi:hypothetical protein
MTDAVLAAADELYGLPLDRFTPERDARAKAAKGDKDLVAGLKPEQVEQVLAVGAALRDAQEGMDGAELRALTKQRRQLTSAVTGQARSLAVDEGVRVTTSVADEVEATLTAAMVDAEAARAVRSGLLVRGLTSTGIEAVDVAAAVAVPDALGFAASPTSAETPAPPELHVVPGDEAARRREEAEQALDEAEATARASEGELEAARAAVGDLQARSLQLQSEIDEHKRALAELESRAEETDDELAEAEEAQAEAEQAHAAAVRRRDAARKALEDG